MKPRNDWLSRTGQRRGTLGRKVGLENRRSLAHRFEVGRVHLERYRAHDQVNGKNHPEPVLLANQNALRTSQRSVDDAHPTADFQIGMRLAVDLIAQPLPQAIHFALRQWRW